MSPRMQSKRRRGMVATVAAAVIAVSAGVMPGMVFAANIVAVTNDATGATSLANAMLANPAILTGASFSAVPPTGTPHGTSDALSFFPSNGSTFAILTTGNVNFADDANTEEDIGLSLGGDNVRGDTDFDVTILKLDLNVPSGPNCLLLDFAFYSDEFEEFVGDIYNDAFIAELDSSTWTTSGSTISAPNNFAFDSTGDVVSINSTGATSMSLGNAAGTTYDGATVRLRAATPIGSGAHSLFLSVFDQGDLIYDSATFIDNVQLVTVGNVQTECVPGATPAPSPTPTPTPSPSPTPTPIASPTPTPVASPTPSPTPEATPTPTPTPVASPTPTPTPTPTPVPTPTPFAFGCTPGYWKQSHHFDSWPDPYDPTDTFVSAGFDDAFSDKTLLDVLKLKGGGLNALGRHTVAALLNGSHPFVSIHYPMSPSQVISQFNAVYPSGNYGALKHTFETANEFGCPLN